MITKRTPKPRKGFRRTRVQLMDEMPRIGNGWRILDVKIGRKWAHVHDPNSGRRSRIARRIWESIEPQAEQA